MLGDFHAKMDKQSDTELKVGQFGSGERNVPTWPTAGRLYGESGPFYDELFLQKARTAKVDKAASPCRRRAISSMYLCNQFGENLMVRGTLNVDYPPTSAYSFQNPRVAESIRKPGRLQKCGRLKCQVKAFKAHRSKEPKKS